MHIFSSVHVVYKQENTVRWVLMWKHDLEIACGPPTTAYFNFIPNAAQ